MLNVLFDFGLSIYRFYCKINDLHKKFPFRYSKYYNKRGSFHA